MDSLTLSLFDLASLSAIAAATSIIAAVLGFGGGMLLIAVMPLYLPAAAIIPIHGVTQLTSNLSRAWFSRSDIAWKLLVPYLLGGVLGVSLVGITLSSISIEVIPLFIGSYILLNLWHQSFMRWIARYESMFVIGFTLSALAVLVGAPGPVFWPVMLKKLPQKNALIATTAAMMTLAHALKLVLFGVLGFAFLSYIWLIVLMAVGATIGSAIGTKLRKRTPDKGLLTAIKVILSALALNMIWQALNNLIPAFGLFSRL